MGDKSLSESIQLITIKTKIVTINSKDSLRIENFSSSPSIINKNINKSDTPQVQLKPPRFKHNNSDDMYQKANTWVTTAEIIKDLKLNNKSSHYSQKKQSKKYFLKKNNHNSRKYSQKHLSPDIKLKP